MKEKELAKQLMVKYKEKLKKELGGVTEKAKKMPEKKRIISQEYKDFKKSFFPKPMSYYEKACNFAEKIAKIKPEKKKRAELARSIEICHLEMRPEGAYAFAIFLPVLVLLLGVLISFVLFDSLFFVFFFVFLALALIYPLMQLPNFWANKWRMKASNQMVQCIFYIVTYMRHTSNLERAIEFSSDHLAAPLSLDLRKVLWDVETGEFDKVKDSLETYLNTWKEWNKEFIESFHLVESSLYEPSEQRRLDMLDKALSVILTETYEKMLHYAHDLQSPITMLHMLGVILPILGLVILPLVVSFMAGEETSPTRLVIYIAALYNVAIPLSVYYLGRIILSKRPTGYGDSDISEENPELKKYKNILFKIGKKEIGINPIFLAVFIFGVLLLIGFSPIILHFLNPGFDIPFFDEKFALLGYICPEGLECALSDRIGPYGIGASILSLAVTMALGLGAGIYFSLRSTNVIKIRTKTKRLEDEFASALFQLGNRLGDGLPAEIAFGKTASIMEGTTSGDFYSTVSRNITKLGMSVKEAIFDKKVGALIYFPSKIIESSMKVLVESARKGPRIAAQALISMSQYIKEIHRVNERLKDLLSEIISSMKSQIKFLTPAIAGIVVGITSMITTILTSLTAQISALTAESGEGAAGIGGIVNLFGSGIPTYYFQIVVGIYVVQITYILVIISNNIENGSDKLTERYNLGKDLVRSTLLYCTIALIVMILFNFIASQIMTGTLG